MIDTNNHGKTVLQVMTGIFSTQRGQVLRLEIAVNCKSIQHFHYRADFGVF